ncbi:MAG: hypothetical protein RIS47_797 [Bacteroidota bacterium]
MAVAIQGGYGAFHQIAAIKYFNNENTPIIPCETFEGLFAVIDRGEADWAILAIENSIAGSLLGNYVLLRESNLKILGEQYLRIEHQLMALPGQSIADITEVQSHPMAIRQCRKFFAQYPHIKLVESDDTALSAKYIADNNIRGMAAIASKLAAELYGLEILFSGIETSKRNYTRFLILSDKNAQSDVPLGQISKASLVFALPHESGSLAQVLSILSYHGMNLTKVQSSPIVGREWEYMFYVDLIFDDYLRYSQAISAIRPLSRNLEIMGEYRRGDLQNGHK